MGLVKFYYGSKLPSNASSNPDVLYFVENIGLYKGANLVADVTDKIAIQGMIDESLESLGNVIKFLGHSSVAITDGSQTKPVIGGVEVETLAPGEVVLYEGQEFIWISIEGEDGTKVEQWELFGDEGSYVTKTALEDFKDSLTSDNGFVVKQAEKADHAETAGHADTAGHATTAESADEAAHAETADHADAADEAGHAETADHATTADSASSAEEAKALVLADKVGSDTQPVYFKADGTPEAIAHTIEASVPSDAKFTDTVTDIAEEKGEGNAVTSISVTDGQLTIEKNATFAEASTVQQLGNDLNGVIEALTWVRITEEPAE